MSNVELHASRNSFFFFNFISPYFSVLLLMIWALVSRNISPSSVANAQNDSSHASGEILGLTHVRRKRYAIFPEGSTFTVGICVTVKLLTPDYDIFTEAVNWALTYDLPKSVADYNNDTVFSSSPPLQARKKRSTFFRQIETFINKRGFDGRACILKSLCEVTQLLPDNDGFLETIIKLLFKMPLQKVVATEPADHHEYDLAYRFGFNSRNSCSEIFSACPFSIIRLLLRLQRAGN